MTFLARLMSAQLVSGGFPSMVQGHWNTKVSSRCFSFSVGLDTKSASTGGTKVRRANALLEIRAGVSAVLSSLQRLWPAR